MKRGVMSTVLVAIVVAALSASAPLPAHALGQAYPQTELTAQVDDDNELGLFSPSQVLSR